MEDTIDRVASRSGTASNYYAPAPSYSAPSPSYHAPVPIVYHAPNPAPAPTYHHYPAHGKDYDFSPIFLSLIPLLFGLGALLGLNLNNDDDPAPAPVTPNVTINSQTSSNSDATSSSSGSNGTSSTSFLPIFVFPNGTLAFPAIIPGLTPIQGLTGITGITLGLGNLFGLIPLPLGRNFPDSEDMDLIVEQGEELDFTPQYVPMSDVWEEFSFNPLYDLFSVGPSELVQRSWKSWSKLGDLTTMRGTRTLRVQCFTRQLCQSQSEDYRAFGKNIYLTSSKLLAAWWEGSKWNIPLHHLIWTLQMGNEEDCDQIHCSDQS
ncbi:uncharacterized protein LOC131879779 [Tigriopus californicus]|uniref:uncharacterized protein LOC131879779 n=1 Tax=Tigriopus californicus TaxID=6832 RepID=UPI0027DA6183|nr:uncharacterized protein LOC131879779 [Tigriopus californicus]